MGIQGLTKLIADNAPQAIKENQINNYFGRKIAVDASMTLHLVGLFYRTIRMIDNGIKPVFVFDGKPPELKQAELDRRRAKAKDAEAAKDQAKEEGDKEALAKMNKRTVRVTPQHNDEAKRLLRLMGVPVVQAPCEAEAQCAALTRAGKVYGVASEDMDSLTLGAPLLLRHMTYSEARKMPIREIRLDRVLEGLDLTMESFIDLCILMGCDYSDTIKGIGPKRALEQIRKYKSIDGILKHLDKEKYPVPESFAYKEIREYFLNPPVTDPEEVELKWTEPDEEGLIQFLAREKAFSEDRVRKGIEKLKKNRQTSVQGRLTSFFTAPAAAKKGAAASASAKKSQTPTKKEEKSDDEMDIDFGIHEKSDDGNEDEESVEEKKEVKEEATGAPSQKEEKKPKVVVKPDPAPSITATAKSWGDIFGKKLGGGGSAKKHDSPIGSPKKETATEKPKLAKKESDPMVIDDDEDAPEPVKKEAIASPKKEQQQAPASDTPKRAVAAKRSRVIDDDEEDEEDAPSKKQAI